MMDTLKQRLKRFGDDERTVSPVVGFVLIFALIMIVFTLYQSSVVPAQNEKVEFEHSQTIEGQMEQLSAAVVNSASATENGSTAQRTSVQLGVQYPTRALAINPGNPVGSLEATDPQPVVVSGLSSSQGDGTQGFNTTFINYRPNYNLFSERREISLEYSMLLKQYPETDTVLAESTDGMFGDDSVNLVLLSSELNERKMSTVVTTEKTGHWNTTVQSGGATITLPTTLPRSQWQTLLDEHEYAQLVDYEDNSPATNRTTISIDDGTTLTANKLSVGDPGTDDGGFDIEPYLTNVTSLSPDVYPGSNGTVVVQATDEFGGPLSGIDLEATSNGSGTVVASNAESGSNGKASFVYDPGSGDNGSTVGVTVALADNGSQSETFSLNYPAVDDGPADNGTPTNRQPLQANQLSTGNVNQLKFKITPPSLRIAGFSVVTKDDASALNETSYSNQFQITDSKYIEGVSGYGPLRYASGEPIQFDGQNYVFENGPRRVVSSDIYLSQWPMSDGVEINEIVDSYDEADIVVYFILQDGSRRPVYIDATVPGSSTTSTASTSTTTNTTTTASTTTTNTTTTDSPSTATTDTTTATDSTTTTETTSS
jgi:hypothetical protein